MKNFFAKFILAASILLAPVLTQAQITRSITASVDHVGQIAINGQNYALIVMTAAGSTEKESFILPPSSANQMMAIALSAMSASKTVSAQFDSSGNLLVLYMNQS